MTDTWLDGGGVVADQPLPEGSWIRFVLDPDDRQKDVIGHVRNGRLHVRGVYRMLDTEQTALNAFDIIPMPLPSDMEKP